MLPSDYWKNDKGILHEIEKYRITITYDRKHAIRWTVANKYAHGDIYKNIFLGLTVYMIHLRIT